MSFNDRKFHLALRIMEQLRTGRDLQDHQTSNLLSRAGLPTMVGSPEPSFERLQGWGIHSFSGQQPVPVPGLLTSLRVTLRIIITCCYAIVQ